MNKQTIITILLALIAIAAQAQIVPEDWFKTDTITIKGRIEGYDAEQFGFTSMECYFEDVFEKDDATLVLDIAEDGTFYKKFQASYPVKQSFHADDSKVNFDEIPFFAYPGETIDITVKKNKQGKLQYILRDAPSDTGTFYMNDILRDVDRINLEDGAIITIGATTLILRAAAEHAPTR